MNFFFLLWDLTPVPEKCLVAIEILTEAEYPIYCIVRLAMPVNWRGQNDYIGLFMIKTLISDRCCEIKSSVNSQIKLYLVLTG